MTILQSLITRHIPWLKSSNISATGGNSIIDSDTYRFHVFTGPGTFNVTSAPNIATVSWIVVAGGGGGGSGGVIAPYGYCGGGGGAGGMRIGTLPIKSGPFSSPPSPTGPWSYSILVGAGGVGGIDGVPTPPVPAIPPTTPPTSYGTNGYGAPGTNSSFDIRVPPGPPTAPFFITALGGGGGSSRYAAKNFGDANYSYYTGRNGGSGAGIVRFITPETYQPVASGGIGNFPTHPYNDYGIQNPGGPQGTPGQGWSSITIATSPTVTFGSGGGGSNPISSYPMNIPSGTSPSGASYYGKGGDGRALAIPGFTPANGYGTSGPIPGAVYFAGGGSGGVRPPWNGVPLNVEGASGAFGGGGGASINANPASPGIVNTGGGGAGAGGTNSGLQGGAGAPGIVIIYYKYDA